MNEADRSLVTHILQDSLQERTLSVVPILDLGMVNRVFRVETSAGCRIVRMNKASGAFREFLKEGWCLQHAAAAGISSPIVLTIAKTGETAYMIETFMQGTNGSLLPKQSVGIWRTLGQTARLAESFPAEGFGLDFDPESGHFVNSFTPTWASHLQYNLDSLGNKDPLLALGVYTPNQQPLIASAFMWLLDSMASGNLKLGLLHGDLSPRNVIVDPDGRHHILDWGCAIVHATPHYGLACLLRTMWSDAEKAGDKGAVMLPLTGSAAENHAAFLSEYGMTISQYHEIEPDIRRILLLDAFDKLRWALDRSPVDVPAFREFAKLMVPFLVQ